MRLHTLNRTMDPLISIYCLAKYKQVIQSVVSMLCDTDHGTHRYGCGRLWRNLQQESSNTFQEGKRQAVPTYASVSDQWQMLIQRQCINNYYRGFLGIRNRNIIDRFQARGKLSQHMPGLLLNGKCIQDKKQLIVLGVEKRDFVELSRYNVSNALRMVIRPILCDCDLETLTWHLD